MSASRPCIVDTSVFVDFFRGHELPVFESLVLENRALLSPYVKLELLLGVRKTEEARLRHVLDGLVELIPHHDIFSAAEKIVARMRGRGVTLGTVDLLLAAQAHLSGYPILSRDKIFAKIAAAKLISVLS